MTADSKFSTTYRGYEVRLGVSPIAFFREWTDAVAYLNEAKDRHGFRQYGATIVPIQIGTR